MITIKKLVRLKFQRQKYSISLNDLHQQFIKLNDGTFFQIIQLLFSRVIVFCIDYVSFTLTGRNPMGLCVLTSQRSFGDR